LFLRRAQVYAIIRSRKEAGVAGNTGIDALQSRRTPGLASTEEKILRRKRDALKRGIHRIDDKAGMPYTIHLVGIGGAGTAVVARTMEQISNATLEADGARMSVLAIDIGDSAHLEAIRRNGMRLEGQHASVQVLQLELPTREDLFASFKRYPDFLQLEYPFAARGSVFKPWIGSGDEIPASGEPVPRAIAKSVYGQAYYDGDRPAAEAIKRFANGVTATPGESLVCIFFGLGGGSGSGIAVDVARHISNVKFGRRMLVVGVGIAPCEGDAPEHFGGHLFPVLNELDCMGDETKNRGVVAACGDLYLNPFTAGFLLVPQQHVWDATKDLEATHVRVDDELASLITSRNGANLWETMRLLNWIAAPSTQHSAARTQYGTRWIHTFAFADVKSGKLALQADIPRQMGLRSTYRPEFVEARIASKDDDKAKDIAEQLESAFGPSIQADVSEGGRTGSLQFVLPQVSKEDLELFAQARSSYDLQSQEEKLRGHSWLLEQGVMLCEPSTTFDGMAGASLWESQNWIAVPHAAVRGDKPVGTEASIAAS
jgi:hypothetical protein